ncbi:PhoD-like phosphatase-domain-containing protein [Dipodascopsis uninucleata]
MDLVDLACVLASSALRVFGYLFLRMAPIGIIPLVIFALFAVYIGSFYWKVFVIDKRAEIKEKITIAMPNERREESSEVYKARRYMNRQVLLGIMAVILGVPIGRRKRLSFFSLFINFTIVLFCVDLIYTSFYFYPEENLSFARLGYVSDTTAQIVFRSIRKGPISVYYRDVLSFADRDDPFNVNSFDEWESITTLESITEKTDHTVPIVLTGLQPDTEYAYSSLLLNGTFRTASQQPGKFSFLSTSCVKARVPYSPVEHPLTIYGFHMYSFLAPLIDFFLFLGDFTYADVPFMLGNDESYYNLLYRQVYSDIALTSFNRVPMIHVFDDHEIINDYDPKNQHLYKAAIDSWKHYQAAGNPSPYRPNTTYYSFERQGIPFFMWDTRTYRSLKRDPDGPSKTMLGEQQLKDFKEWLDATSGVPFKIIVSSCPFTKNWRGVDSLDTWAGYLHERQKILYLLWKTKGRVVILSGDRHEAAAIKFPSPDGNDVNDVYEFSTSPFSQFYIPIRTHIQLDDEDITLMYMSTGNNKVGKIDIETRLDGTATLEYHLYIEGNNVWNYTLDSL